MPRFDDGVGHFFAAVRRQAVHEDRLGAGAREQRLVHLERAEDRPALRGLGFLAHADPGVGVDHVGRIDGFPRIVRDANGRARLASPRAAPLDHLRRRFEAGRRRDGEVHAQQRAAEDERVQHVVPIPHPRQFQPPQLLLDLAHRHVVGESLAGMAEVGQAVDDRNRGGARELHDRVVREGADHDALHHALEVPGDVGDGFSLADADLGGGQVNGVPAELIHADVERDARAERRLLENHPERLPAERAGEPQWVGLHDARPLDERPDVVGGQIAQRQEVAALEAAAAFVAGSCRMGRCRVSHGCLAGTPLASG